MRRPVDVFFIQSTIFGEMNYGIHVSWFLLERICEMVEDIRMLVCLSIITDIRNKNDWRNDSPR